MNSSEASKTSSEAASARGEVANDGLEMAASSEEGAM